MGRRTLCTLPLSAELLKPEPPDPWTLWSETTRRKEASKAQYDKHQDRPSCHCHLVPMFTQNLVHLSGEPLGSMVKLLTTYRQVPAA